MARGCVAVLQVRLPAAVQGQQARLQVRVRLLLSHAQLAHLRQEEAVGLSASRRVCKQLFLCIPTAVRPAVCVSTHVYVCMFTVAAASLCAPLRCCFPALCHALAAAASSSWSCWWCAMRHALRQVPHVATPQTCGRPWRRRRACWMRCFGAARMAVWGLQQGGPRFVRLAHESQRNSECGGARHPVCGAVACVNTRLRQHGTRHPARTSMRSLSWYSVSKDISAHKTRMRHSNTRGRTHLATHPVGQ